MKRQRKREERNRAEEDATMCFEEERTFPAAVEVVSPSTTEALTKGAIDPARQNRKRQDDVSG